MEWLLIDVSNLGWRAAYTTGDLDNGVLYGILRQIPLLQDRFQTTRMAFCFDQGRPKRADLLPGYKAKKHDPDREQLRTEVRRQLHHLRERILPRLGYRNVFGLDGYEADDVIAALTVQLGKDDANESVIVSSDADFWQLITQQCKCYNPVKKETTDAELFRRLTGLYWPLDWISVKALAGCVSDSIRGIEGVGEATAIKYLKGELKRDSAAVKKIEKSKALIQRNIDLVRLPFDAKCGPFELVDDEISIKEWKALCKELNMPSLADQPPRGGKRSTGPRHGGRTVESKLFDGSGAGVISPRGNKDG